ncbi:MAG: four helix bundle protein [Parcubacteria group bacterium]
MGEYIGFRDLEVYRLAREVSRLSWDIYKEFDWQTKKIIGDQFITAIDSVGANIAEGYGRYHFLDRIKFYYNARGSFLEYLHWLDVLEERKLIDGEDYRIIVNICDELHLRLNNFIKSTYQTKNQIS